MFQAVGRFLANVTGPSGVMLVLDDLQWAGPDALDLLATLLHAPSEAPLRVVAAYRDTEVYPNDPLAGLLADLARDSLVTQHALRPLTPGESTKLFDLLLEEVTEEVTRPPTHMETLVRRTGGVPFFIVSCAHLMRERAIDAGQAADIPWDVAQNIRQRMAALPTAAQELLGTAAIIGRQAPRALLVSATTRLGWSKHGTLVGLEAACQARLLVESGPETYQFAHDLIREGISTMLSSARRAAFHEAVAEALEQTTGEPVVEQLAFHYSRAGDIEKAIVYLERAGDRAHAMRAHAEEITYYQELVERLQTVGRVMALAAASEKLGRALLAAARYGAALDAFNQAVEIYRTTDDVEGVGRVLTHIGRAHAQRGTALEGLAFLQPLIPRLSESVISAGTLATLCLAQAQLFAFSGQYTSQLAAATQAADLAGTTHDDCLLAQAELYRGDALGGLHHQEDALQVMERVIPLAEAAGDLFTLSEALNNVAQAYENRGEFDKSMPYMDRALHVAEQLGDPVQLALVTCNRGQSAFYVGEWSQAHSYHERAVMMMSHLDRSLISAYPLGGLGVLLLAEGQREVGTSYLQEIASTGQRSDDLGLLRYARCALAECDLLDGHPEKVVTALTPLLDQPGREETGVIKLLPLLAWAYLQSGDVSKADALVEQSLTRATAQSMRRLQPDGLRVKALLAIRQESWQVAERLLEESVSLCRAMRYPYGEAKTLYVYGLLHMRKGEPEQACAQLEAMLATCARLGERLYAEHAERLLAELHEH
jgi:tetratricopeptide (TPR) repeat protein